jgi:hypothetical protein
MYFEFSSVVMVLVCIGSTRGSAVYSPSAEFTHEVKVSEVCNLLVPCMTTLELMGLVCMKRITAGQ